VSARRAAVRALRAADRAVARAVGRCRVLVEARTPMNAVVLQPIWKQLLGDARIAVEFTAEDPRAAEVLVSRGLTVVDRARARWRRYDLALSADPWYAAPLHRCHRRINTFHGVAGKYDLDSPSKLPFDFSIYHRILFASEDRMRRYLAEGVVSPQQAVLTGFPKMDSLVRGEWSKDEERARFGLPEAATVLYAPTFSPASSLQTAGEAIVDTLLVAGFNVLAKLHDRSMVPHPKYTDGVDWPARLQRFESSPGFRLVRDADVTPCFAAADVLVTDHSTVGFEFALMDRPVIVYDVPALKEAARIDAGKWDLLRSMADVVRTAAELPAAVQLALVRPERLRDERRQSRTLFAFPGTATDRALDAVYDALELTRPEQSYRAGTLRSESVATMPTWSESAASPAGDIAKRSIEMGRNPRTQM
jgi:hypothetical protein